MFSHLQNHLHSTLDRPRFLFIWHLGLLMSVADPLGLHQVTYFRIVLRRMGGNHGEL